MLNKTVLFAYLRKAPFGGRLTQAQVDGVNAVLDACDRYDVSSAEEKAYILATAFHETGGKMQPVREGFASSDAGARRVVAARKYGKPDPKTGHVYYGRGLVQLTWRENYEKLGGVFGIDLVRSPDLALRSDISANVLVYGMQEGIFTGKKLADYFTGKPNPEGARRIVNGTDKASLIASYYDRILAALKAAEAQDAKEVKAADAKPDKPALATDKTVIGTITSVLGAGGAGVFAAIDNPWAFAAVAVVVLGVLLFVTGRLEIRRKAGA